MKISLNVPNDIGENINKKYPQKNKAVSDLLQEIKNNGGIKKETAEEIGLSGQEFRDDFQFEHDKS